MGVVPLQFVAMHDTHSQLLAEIEAFLATHRIAATKFGLMAVHDGKLVGRLRARKDLRVSTVERVREFLRSQQEKEAA